MQHRLERPAGIKAGQSPFAIRTVSHTLATELAERLRAFAFQMRVSESAVMEHALALFLASASEDALASQLREAGYGRRRKIA